MTKRKKPDNDLWIAKQMIELHKLHW
jgi:hypothetical protein